MVTIFQVVAGIFAAAAIYFFWADNTDAAFFTLVLALCGFFLSLRFKTSSRIAARRTQNETMDVDQ